MPEVQCSNCGRSVPANRWVCPYCGAALDRALDEQHAYIKPVSPAGLFRRAIPLHRRSPEEPFEPVRASHWPSPFVLLEWIAVGVVLIVLFTVVGQWFKRNQAEQPAAVEKPTLSQNQSSSIIAQELEGAPRAEPTSGASPTPFVLILPTPKGNDALPPVTLEPLPAKALQGNVLQGNATPGGTPQGDASQSDEVIQITSGTGKNYSPALSRDQRRFVYTSLIDGHWQIVEAEPGTGKLIRQITSGDIDYYTPLFNVDGSQLLVVADWSVNLDIFLISYADGRVLRQLTFTKEADFAPAWLPDYTGFVFTSLRDGNAELYYLPIPEVQVNEPEVTRLTDDPSFDGYPNVSHDGVWVTFYSDRAQEYQYDVYVMLLSTHVARRLTRDSGRDAFPIFAPGDAWIIFESNRTGNSELFSIRPNAIDDSAAQNLTYSEANEYMPAFSPDGLWLYYLSDYHGGMDIYRRPWP